MALKRSSETTCLRGYCLLITCPENPDRLIVLSQQKKSQRLPSHSAALPFILCRREEDESGLRGEKNEGRGAEKLHAKAVRSPGTD